MNISEQGKSLIKGFEKCRLKAYKVTPDGRWTIGWGSETYADGRSVKEGDVITQKEADILFDMTIGRYESIVRDNVKRNVKQNEFDALTSFAYNCGAGYKVNNTWTKYNIWNKATRNVPADEMIPYWQSLCITSNKKPMPGLVRRRKSEVHLYVFGELDFFE